MPLKLVCTAYLSLCLLSRDIGQHSLMHLVQLRSDTLTTAHTARYHKRAAPMTWSSTRAFLTTPRREATGVPYAPRTRTVWLHRYRTCGGNVPLEHAGISEARIANKET
jgi:hypothetical protein